MHSYPKIYNLGHYAVRPLLDDPVIVQEKIDGSQISFGMLKAEGDAGQPYWRLVIRSKGQEIHWPVPEKDMFFLAVQAIIKRSGLLKEGWTYRGEFLMKPKHNVLAYSRVPTDNIILFDIDKGEEDYLNSVNLRAHAQHLGLETVPTIHIGNLTLEMLCGLLDRESVLGGQKIEGVVIKNYGRYGSDKKTLMGKHVREEYKEIHAKLWKTMKPGRGDIVLQLIERFRTEARWQKAVNHLREAGTLLEEPKDIGSLIMEVKRDLLEEEGEWIKERIFDTMYGDVSRGVTRGLAEWYKGELLKKQFNPSCRPENHPDDCEE